MRQSGNFPDKYPQKRFGWQSHKIIMQMQDSVKSEISFNKNNNLNS